MIFFIIEIPLALFVFLGFIFIASADALMGIFNIICWGGLTFAAICATILLTSGIISIVDNDYDNILSTMISMMISIAILIFFGLCVYATAFC